MSVLILVVDDEPDVELLFRQRFRHDLKAERFLMEFAQSGSEAASIPGSRSTSSRMLSIIRRMFSVVRQPPARSP